MPPIPELSEPLTDGTISLRPAAERDIPEVLIAYEDDPQLHVRLGQVRPPTGAQLGSRSEQAQTRWRAGQSVLLAVTEAGSDTCRGEVDVHHIDWDHARAELGLWLAPQVRGRGYAPRALRLAAGWLFATWGLGRVAVLAHPQNEAMIAAARAAGFTHEGVLRARAVQRGRRVDQAVLSLLPGDLVP